MKEKSEVSSERWNLAQESEKEYWNTYTTDSLKKESGDRYPKKAAILLSEWKKFINVNKNIRILQIGCGPEDVINYFPEGKCFSIDPLAEFYKKRFNFDYKKSGLTQGTGEKIPFPDDYFDIVILINVLDHVHLPGKVLAEIKRVLKSNGLFHFENYFYQEGFIFLAKIFGAIKKIFTGQIFNIHHPYMFTSGDLRELLSGYFTILKEETGRDIGSYENMQDLRKKRLSSRRMTVKLPAIFGLYGIINYTAICRN